MAKLIFLAVPGHAVMVPGAQIPGVAPLLVGHTIGVGGGLEPTGKTYECEENSAEAMRYRKLMAREGALKPADEYTAQVCGVEFSQPKKGADK